MNNGATKFTVNSPGVQALVENTYRCSPQTYFRISEETGECYVFAIRKAFIQLGMSAKTASRLLRDCDIPMAEFIRNDVQEPVEPEPDQQAIMQAALEAAARESARQEKLSKKAELEERANSRRYQLIETNSGKFGIWQADEGRVICLYLTQEEAVEEMARLRSGSSQAGFYHYGSKRSRQPELQGTHY